jgi:ATP synthase protein I
LDGALSALLGGVLVISAGVVYAVVIRMSSTGESTAGGTVRTMIRAEAAKITMIVIQLWLVLTTYRDVEPAPLFLAFVVTVLVSTAAITIRD